jgi:sirohydrochlorin cobaltochelatase
MREDGYRDATLLLLAHGSTVNADSARPALRLAEALGAEGRFAAVAACFWKQEPALLPRVTAASTPRVFVVPLMTGPGYFVEEVIPQALGLKLPGAAEFARVQRRDGRLLYYTHPVGTHPRLVEVLRERARAVVAAHPFPRTPRPAETTLVVVGHGTERAERSRRAVEVQVARLRERGEYAAVQPAFMEIAPRVAEAVAAAATRAVVVVPLFISDGLHAAEDIPVLLGEPAERVQARVQAGVPPWRNPTERFGKLIWYAPGLGEAPELADVVRERVHEAAGWVPSDQSPAR